MPYTEEAQVDFGLLNNANVGRSVVDTLSQNDFDWRSLRPWTSKKNGRTYITRNINGTLRNIPVQNAFAPFFKDDWIEIDKVVQRVAKPEMRIVDDLRSQGLVYNIPNGMAKSVLQYQRITDIGPATISMDGNRLSESDRPLKDLVNLPLPIIHKDIDLPARQVMMSRNSGEGVDMESIEAATIRVAETAEMLTLGTLSYNNFGGGYIYGLKNYPNRITQTLTAPNGSNQSTTVNEVLAMQQLALTAFQRGPFKIYYSLPWSQYMESDYNLYRGLTLKQRLEEISGVGAGNVVLADFMHTGYSLLMVQQKASTIRIVTGMDVTTVQWESNGGMNYHFKIMCILVPQLRCDSNGNTGIVHGFPVGQA